MLPVAKDVGETSEPDIVRCGVVSDVIMVADGIVGDDDDPVSSVMNKRKKNQDIPIKHSSMGSRQKTICRYTLSRPRPDILHVKARSCSIKLLKYIFSIIKKMTFLL